MTGRMICLIGLLLAQMLMASSPGTRLRPNLATRAVSIEALSSVALQNSRARREVVLILRDLV